MDHATGALYPASLAVGNLSGGTTSAADSLAIPVTHRYVAKTTGADAEALTLADGVAGQKLTISLVADGGGDGTLTPTTKSGFTTIVFANVGDTVTLLYVDDTTGWVIIGIAGAKSNSVRPTAIEGSTTSDADSLAIPVTHRYVAKTTGADAEALTLADGYPGQELTVTLATDGGGDGTLTPTTKTGFTNVVLANAGDSVSLKFVDGTVGWVITGLYGAKSNSVRPTAIEGSTTSDADSLAIPVTHRYVAKTTGADAEALTLADGYPGQELTISLVTDGGGDGTLTPTTKSGFTTIVFANAGDTVTLLYVDDTTGWVIIGIAGAKSNSVRPTAIEGSTTVDADDLTIPVTHRYVAKTTGGDAEALTLADGYPGQELTISLVSDGNGDGTLTPTTKSGFATIVFADAGDTATLRFVDGTVGWVIVGLAGVSAPPAITV
jgi:hypothetical protein